MRNGNMGRGLKFPMWSLTLGTAVGGALILNGKLYRSRLRRRRNSPVSIDYQGVDFMQNKGH